MASEDNRFDPLKAVWFWKIITIALTVSLVWTMLKSEQKTGQIAVRDTELRFTLERTADLKDEITFLRAQILKQSKETHALESALGLLPDPNDPIAIETARVAKRNVLAHADYDDCELMYRYLVGIGYRETRFDNSLVGTSGEKSTFQIMGYHYDENDRKNKDSIDVGAKLAIKVLYDIGFPENPNRLYLYNGSRSPVTLAYQASVKRNVNQFFGS